MRIYNRLPLLAAVLLLLPSCDKPALQGGGTGLPMRIAPTLAGDTKGSLTTADLTDFYLQVSAADPAYSYFEHASKDGSGAWTTPSRLYWKDETTPVSYAAARFGAHAFTAEEFADGVDLTLPADQSTQERLNAADLLTMPAATARFEDTTDGTLPVTLAHGLAKVTFTLTLGPEFYDNFFTRKANPVKEFTVKGSNIGFNFTPQTGAVSVAADTKADITALPGAFTPGTSEAKNATAVYEAILVPQVFAAGALKVSFKVGTYDYEWSNADAVTLAAGKTYDLAVSVSTSPVTQINGHQFVDMGGGLKWATCNVGADNPEDYGDYFAWGETEPYYNGLDPLVWKSGKNAGYSWDSYFDTNDGGNSFTKYSNTPGKKTVLEADDDAATVNWGGSWRMPTDAEWTELLDNCTSLWTTQNGVSGCLFTAPNGNSIFLPAAGSRYETTLYSEDSGGDYWCSSLGSDDPYNRSIGFDSGGVGRYDISRCRGQSVRAVSK